MKINYTLISRVLIALLFVVAGVQKAMDFAGATGYVESLGLPLPAVLTAIVILIEVPVALAFAWGYRVCATGWTLIAFTLLTIILVHRDISIAGNLVMALKNLAIAGGILATIQLCECGTCPVSKEVKA